MKKFLPGLSVAAIAFAVGVSAVGVFNFKKEIVSNPPVKESFAELPLNKVEPLPAPLMFEENMKGEFADEPKDERLFSGWYEPDDSRDMPEVELIALSTYYGAHEHSDEIFLWAGIFTSLGRDTAQGLVSISSGKIENNQVQFRTKKIKGFEYRFEGAFFKNKTTGEFGEKILRGTLKKFKKGKKIAEIGGDFAYYEPHCWH